MTIEQLMEGQELTELIRVTKKALDNLSELEPKDRQGERIYDDRLYNFCICEHKDGSGIRGILARYDGNVALLNVIVEEPKRQLTDYEEKLANL